MSDNLRRVEDRGALSLLAIIALTVSPAHAQQQPRVPVPISAEGPMACSTARMLRLEGGREPLSVRTGPSRRERELLQLPERTPVYACLLRGRWFGIVFEHPSRDTDCGVQRVWPRAGSYRGPCRSGWVHWNHIGEYADWISP